MNKQHTCRQSRTCICSATALEPDEQCPIHGVDHPPRCETCGRYVKAKSRIITAYINPPIPERSFDWVAYRVDVEEYGRKAFGSTEEEAIAELLEREAEDAQ
jgi:hypothetical protein